MRENRRYRFTFPKIRTLADQRFLITWIAVSFAMSVLLTAGVAAGTFYGRVLPRPPGWLGGTIQTVQPVVPPSEVFNSDKLTFILLGYDSVDEFAHRSDTLMVGAVDFYAPSIRILSIPRDVLVDIPGYGFDRINAAYALGQEDLTRRTVEKFLGVKIDYVVSVNYQGFIGVIDALGGVDITVDRAMNYDDRRGDVHIHFQPGTYHMDGDQALEYARFRHDAISDIGRIQRQQHLILSLFDQAIRPGNWGKLQRAAQAFLQNMTVTTNADSPRHVPQIGLDQALSMIGFLSQLDSSRIRFYQVSCVDVRWRDRACLRPVYADTLKILSEVFQDNAVPGWETPVQNVPQDSRSTGSGEIGLAGAGQGE